mmetsp:Transcript_19375/g.56436  ORF Transcript_19375/g.56436 Transcript_19375/m.56436 type:complete len:399 (-) Transcript_19375:1988-3184(-)
MQGFGCFRNVSSLLLQIQGCPKLRYGLIEPTVGPPQPEDGAEGAAHFAQADQLLWTARTHYWLPSRHFFSGVFAGAAAELFLDSRFGLLQDLAGLIKTAQNQCHEVSRVGEQARRQSSLDSPFHSVDCGDPEVLKDLSRTSPGSSVIAVEDPELLDDAQGGGQGGGGKRRALTVPNDALHESVHPPRPLPHNQQSKSFHRLPHCIYSHGTLHGIHRTPRGWERCNAGGGSRSASAWKEAPRQQRSGGGEGCRRQQGHRPPTWDLEAAGEEAPTCHKSNPERGESPSGLPAPEERRWRCHQSGLHAAAAADGLVERCVHRRVLQEGEHQGAHELLGDPFGSDKAKAVQDMASQRVLLLDAAESQSEGALDGERVVLQAAFICVQKLALTLLKELDVLAA